MYDFIENHPIDGIEIHNDDLMISMKKVPQSVGILERCLDELAEAKINVDIISQTYPVKNAIDVSFIVKIDALEKVVFIINELGDEYPEIKLNINKNITRLSVSGIGMRTQPGVAAKFFQVMADHNIQILMTTTSEIRISSIIHRHDAPKALTATKAAFHIEE